MKKVKKIVSSATLLSVGGIGIMSYVSILEPNKEYVAPATYLGLDEIEYDSIQDAANTFIIEDYEYYVDGENTFYNYEEYEIHQLEQIVESDVYNIDQTMYESESDIYQDNQIENYMLYKNDYYTNSELSLKTYEEAENSMVFEKHLRIIIPTYTYNVATSPWYIIPDQEKFYVELGIKDINFEQSFFGTESVDINRFYIPEQHEYELEQLKYSYGVGLHFCTSENIRLAFKNYLPCDEIYDWGYSNLYKDLSTGEQSIDLNELATKRANLLRGSAIERYKFNNVYFKSKDEISDHIESLKEKRFEWNGNYYSNLNVITNNIFVHFKEIEEDIKVEETRLCNDVIVSTEDKYDYVLNNYDSLVNKCIYGNISM